MAKLGYISVIQDDLVKVRQLMLDALRDSTHSKIQDIVSELMNSPGKQLRPALCLLSYRAVTSEPVPDRVYQLAAAIELIHMASLVHDDVIDDAPLRHEVPTVYAKYGQEVAIPIGVYLYTVALLFIAKIGDSGVLDKVSQSVKALCEGELIQVFDRGNVEVSLDQYFELIQKKTAVLFQAACEMGATFGGASSAQIAALRDYGNSLGYSFQIADDYMDIVGSEADLKKKSAQDVEMGEMTLPFIYFLQTASVEERELVNDVFKNAKVEKLSALRKALIQSSALEQTKQLAVEHIQTAQDKLAILPRSEARGHMVDIAKYILERGFKSNKL